MFAIPYGFAFRKELGRCEEDRGRPRSPWNPTPQVFFRISGAEPPQAGETDRTDIAATGMAPGEYRDSRDGGPKGSLHPVGTISSLSRSGVGLS